jgi:hypothetical protein
MDLKFQLQFATESLKKDIRDSIDRFHKATNLMPSRIKIDMIETTTMGKNKEFEVGQIDVEFDF